MYSVHVYTVSQKTVKILISTVTARPCSSGPPGTRAATEPPALVVSSTASSGVYTAAFLCDSFFNRPLFLWMPYRMWSVRLSCLQPACYGHRLTSCGLYKVVRQVLALASEYLECGKCHKKYTAWSDAVLQQLDVGHRSYFPAVLTYK